MSGPATRRHLGLVLLTKSPTAGLAKRRLGAQVGAQAAASAARVLLENTLDVCLAVAPRVHGFYRGPLAALPQEPRVTWLPSRGDDPVVAVLAAFRELAGEYERLVAVPSDVPGMTSAYLAGAAAALDRCNVVLGPSLDGGLVLFGAAGELPDELADIRSSSGRLHDDVLACCAEHHLSVESLTPLTDLDTWWSISRAIDEGELREDSELHARLVHALTTTRTGPPGCRRRPRPSRMLK